MNLDESKVWLERVCGAAGAPAPDLAVDMRAFEKKGQFIATDLAGDDFEAQKIAIRKGLKGLTLQNKKKVPLPLLGKIKIGGHGLTHHKTMSREILATIADGKKIPIGIQDDEWDSVDDQAATTSSITVDGKAVDFKSEEAMEAIQGVANCLQPLLDLSHKMESEVDENGKPLFSKRDIEKELWSPLVREGVIPSNLVPAAYSETVNVMRNGTAIYVDLMEREDGNEMGEGKIDKLLGLSKDVIKLASVAGGEALRYVDGSIIEASREDLANFIDAKAKVDINTENLAELEKIGADIEALEADGTAVSKLEITKGKFDDQKGIDGGEDDYDKWLNSENKRLTAAIEDAEGADKEALEAELASIEGAQLTQDFGEHLRHQAMLNSATALATGSIEAAQRARDRKRSRRDIGEALLEGMLGAAGGIVTASTSGENLTGDDGTKTREHALKYALLGSKAGMRGLNKITQAIHPSSRTDDPNLRAMLVGAVSDILEGAGDAFAAMGKVDSTDTPSIGVDKAIDKDSDTREEAASFGMIGKSAGMTVKAIDQLVAAAQKRDLTQIGAIIMTLGAAAPSAIFAGQVGDGTRADRDLDHLSEGKGDKDTDNSQREWFADPFEEVRGAAGQSGFGMSGDMATVADQRAILAETSDLLGQIKDESYKDTTAAVKAGFDRCRKLAAGNPKLAEDPDVSPFLDPDLAEDLTPEDIERAIGKMQKTLEDVEMDGAEQSAEKDQAILGRLSGTVDKVKLGGDLDALRGMLDDMGGDEDGRPDDQVIFAKFKEVRDEMLKDERVFADIETEIAEEEGWFDDLKQQADLTRLDSFAGPDLREKERKKAISAIETLTIELKKSEMKLKMLDQATKGAVGIALACAPGAALLGKIRDLVADCAKLHRRNQDLKKWSAGLAAMRGNYSAYEDAVRGEKEVLTLGVVHDSLTVAADVAGVAAETLRLADHTHVGAAAATSIEKITDALNTIWFARHGKGRIKEGWKLFQLAQRQPENRRLARQAIRTNTTLGKCVIAYGACIDKDAQARRIVQSCGLTPEVFEDSSDVCQSVVDYLRARLNDKEFETIASHDNSDWMPCELEPNLQSWTMVKAAACRIIPPMAPQFGATPSIDQLIGQLTYKTGDGQAADAQGQLKIATDLRKALKAYRPQDDRKKLHAEMTVAAMDLAEDIQKLRLELGAIVKAEKKAAAGGNGN